MTQEGTNRLSITIPEQYNDLLDTLKECGLIESKSEAYREALDYFLPKFLCFMESLEGEKFRELRETCSHLSNQEKRELRSLFLK